MEPDEYPRMAAVEDAMWYHRALRAHLDRELRRALAPAPEPASRPARGPAPSTPPGPPELLDAGCGTGGFLRHASAHHPGWRCVGLDVDEIACRLARARSPAVDIRQASVLALPFTASRFDAVLSADVLYHLDDDLTALREMHRVLKPGGALVINVPAHPWLWSYHDVAVHARRRYTRSDLRERLARAGFGEISATHWNLLPLPLLIARRKLFPPRRPGGSDVRLFPAPVEWCFRRLMSLEQAWLRAGGRLPAGSSLLAVARRPLNASS